MSPDENRKQSNRLNYNKSPVGLTNKIINTNDCPGTGCSFGGKLIVAELRVRDKKDQKEVAYRKVRSRKTSRWRKNVNMNMKRMH